MQRNYKLLKSLVSKNDIINLKKQYVTNSFGLLKIIIYSILIIFIIFFVGYIALLLSGLGWQYVISWVLFIIVAIIICIFMYNKYQNIKWIEYVRLNRFAEANELNFYPVSSNINYEGMIFNIGKQRKTYNQLISKLNNIFEIFNYKYTIGSGKSEREVKNGCIMVKLNRNLPHMVLDSNSNNVKFFGINLTNLPVSFKNNQKLSLEGDFDKYFTLYAPKEYKRDALYIFTPDLMSLLIDESNAFDAEIVDNKLFFYSKSPFNMLDESTLKLIFKIIETVGSKLIFQTKQYTDERVDSRVVDVISEPGRRLKRRISWLAIIIVAIFVVYFLIKTFIDLL